MTEYRGGRNDRPKFLQRKLLRALKVYGPVNRYRLAQHVYGTYNIPENRLEKLVSRARKDGHQIRWCRRTRKYGL